MKRQRGRTRKPGQNSQRVYESNGPDMKIRGSASQIYDKYIQLSRDCLASGNRVKSENHLQHAEHYFRIVRAHQPSSPPPKQEVQEGKDDRSVTENHDSHSPDRKNGQISSSEHSSGTPNTVSSATESNPLGIVKLETQGILSPSMDSPESSSSDEKRSAPRKRMTRRRVRENASSDTSALNKNPAGTGLSETKDPETNDEKRV